MSFTNPTPTEEHPEYDEETAGDVETDDDKNWRPSTAYDHE